MKELLNEWKKFLSEERIPIENSDITFVKQPIKKPAKADKAAKPSKPAKTAKTPGLVSYSYSSNLITFLKQVEGFSDVPYQNKGDKPTIGYGTTYYVVGGKEIPVTLKDKPITKEQGEKLMKNYLNSRIMPSLNKYLKNKPMNQNQIDALVSVMYNMGNKKLLDTELFTVASKNPNDPRIKNLFLSDKLATVGGVVSPGLKERRKKEYELYMSSEGIDYKQQQSIAPVVESP